MRVSDPTYDERKAGNRVSVRFRASPSSRQLSNGFIECAKHGLRGWGSAARSPNQRAAG